MPGYIGVLLFYSVIDTCYCHLSLGLSFESSADVVGEPYHGYFCIPGSGDRASHGVSA